MPMPMYNQRRRNNAREDVIPTWAYFGIASLAVLLASSWIRSWLFPPSPPRSQPVLYNGALASICETYRTMRTIEPFPQDKPPLTLFDFLGADINAPPYTRLSTRGSRSSQPGGDKFRWTLTKSYAHASAPLVAELSEKARRRQGGGVTMMWGAFWRRGAREDWGSLLERRYSVMVASYNILYNDETRDYYFRKFLKAVRDKADKRRTVWVSRGWGEIEGLCGEKLRG